MFEAKEYLQAQRWLPCRNLSGEEAPPYAVMFVTDTYDDGTLQVDKPDADRGTWQVVINGPTAIPDQGYGECTRDFPARALCNGFDAGNAYTVNNSWQFGNDSSDVTGFQAIGGAVGGAALVVYAGKAGWPSA